MKTAFTIWRYDGVLAPQFNSFICKLKERLADRWKESISIVLGWVRARLAVAIQCSASLCVEGAKRRFKTCDRLLGYEHGIDT